MSYPLLGNKGSHPLGWCLLCLTTKQLTPWGGVSFAALSYSKSKGIYHPFVSVLENCSPVAPKTTMEIILSFRGAQYHCKAQICVFSSVRHASLPLQVNIAKYCSLGMRIKYRVQYHPSKRIRHENVSMPATRLEPWTLWVQEQCHTNSATATLHTKS